MIHALLLFLTSAMPAHAASTNTFTTTATATSTATATVTRTLTPLPTITPEPGVAIRNVAITNGVDSILVPASPGRGDLAVTADVDFEIREFQNGAKLPFKAGAYFSVSGVLARRRYLIRGASADGTASWIEGPKAVTP